MLVRPGTNSRIMSDPSWWHRLHAGRLGWAERAREDLVGALEDDDVRWLYETAPGEGGGDAARVAVLGPTQVGKTTVILRLLGLTEEGERTVGKVLRGGRRLGRSASATASIYGASPDDAFHYQEGPEGSKESLTEAEVLERLEDLRGRVDAGAFRETDAVSIRFPSRYFSAEANPRLRVIDLPGFDDSGEIGNTLVEEVLDRYLPLATLALLVERADNLASLGFLAVPGAGEGWLSFPERYAVVLTRAAAPSSVQEQIRKGRYTRADDLQEMYRDEIVRALEPESQWGLDELRDVVGALSLFPVDLGESRSRLPADVSQLVAPVLDEAENALLGRVAAASEPSGALTLTAGLHRASAQILRNVEQGHAALVQRIDQKMAATRDALSVLEAQCLRYERDRDQGLEKKLDRGSIVESIVPAMEAGPPPWNNVKRDTLKGHVAFHAIEVEKKVRAAVKAADARGLALEEGLLRNAKRAFDGEVHGIRQRLSQYGVDFYAPWRGKKAQRDARAARDQVQSGVAKAQGVIRRAVQASVDAANKRVKRRVEGMDRKLVQVRVRSEDEAALLDLLSEKRARATARFELRRARLLRDVEVGREFLAFLDGRYAREHFQHRAAIESPESTDVERFASLCYLHLAADVRRQLGGRINMT